MAPAVSSSTRASRAPLSTEPEVVAGRPHAWTVEEYHRIREAGGFEEKVELLEGMIVDTWADGEDRRHRWTPEEFDRLAENGAFGDLRIELVNGEVVDMSPQGDRHYIVLRRVERALQHAFGAGYDVRVQGPFATPETRLEPDALVVEGTPEDYPAAPRTGLLAVEVSVSSLSHDRDTKVNAYAVADVPEYWIVNLPGACVEVYRDPLPTGTYVSTMILRAGDTLAPLAAPDAVISVADFLI